uniref:C-type lectin domain-containing protein n=1 Tax=Magallana gigas TaxID=29159 RepID=K1R658_MAGGI
MSNIESHLFVSSMVSTTTLSENTIFHGVACNTSCVCLSDPFSVTEAIDPRLCNTSCSTSEIVNDCGGPGTYSNDSHLQKFVSNATMNWTEAVQYCTERNATLVYSPIQTTQRDQGKGYWTRKQRRSSLWIHVIGCFNETQIDPSQSVNKTLTSTSVVTCQQECSFEHYTFFGLQKTKEKQHKRFIYFLFSGS